MSLILNEKYVGENSSYKLFLSNRLLRLFPIYWVILLLVLLRSLYLLFVDGVLEGNLGQFILYHNHINFTSFCFLIFANICLLGQDLLMFLGLNLDTHALFFTKNFSATTPPLYSFLAMPQSWTIGIEIAFYIIAPFILRKRLAFIFFLIGLSIGLRLILLHNGLNRDPWTYRFFPNEIVFFMLGNISYRFYKRLKEYKFNKYFLLSITAIVILYTLFFNRITIPHTGTFFFMTLIVLLPFVFIYTKSQKVDNKIGELSYPVYLSHLFIYSWIRDFEITKTIGIGLSVSLCSVLFSLLLIKTVAEPIDKIRQRRLA